MRGARSSLVAVLVFGVGLVLFALGFDSHTTEALPFGVVALVVGAALGVPSLRALRHSLRPAPAPAAPTATVAEVLDDALPASVRCASCGSAARLRLDAPDAAACEHCDHRTPFPPALAARVAQAAAAARSADRTTGAIGDVIASLPQRERALGRRLLSITIALASLAAGAALFGWVRRFADDDWHGYVTFGAVAGVFALVAGLGTAALLPRVLWGVVSHWTALRLPGLEGLGCRVCGAPLPAQASAVLRCEYCAADNLATPTVLERVERSTAHAASALRSMTTRARQADELASHSLVSFPLLVLLGWFAVGAAAGGVGLRALGDVQLGPDRTAEFAIIDGCIVAVAREGGRVTLVFDAERREAVTTAPPVVPVTDFVGRAVRAGYGGGSRVVKGVFRELRSPGRHRLDLGEDSIAYLPAPSGGGEPVCFEGLAGDTP